MKNRLTPTSLPEQGSQTGTPSVNTPMLPLPTNTGPSANPSPTSGDQPEAAVKARETLAQALSVSPELVMIGHV